jgi:hypothetical protein
MTGLRTARVAVIDDVRDEAFPLIQGLGRRGIGCVYVPGDKLEELPSEPIRGLRLVFLDMELGVGGTSKQIATSLIGVMKKVVAEKTSPIAIVAWTDHPEHIEEFKKALASELPNLRLGLVENITKPFETVGGRRQIDATEALRQVGELLSKHEPMGLLWAWEELVHHASSETTQVLGEVASALASSGGASGGSTRDEWLAALRSVIKELIRSGAGRHDDQASEAAAFLGLMNFLHLDRLEELGAGVLDADLGRACSGSGIHLPEQQRAELNTRLLATSVPPSDKSVRPGNVYLLDSALEAGCPVHRCGVDGTLLAEGMTPKLPKDSAYGKLHVSHNEAKQRGLAAKVAALEAEMQMRQEQIISECLPALIEVTPSCDFSQKKRPLARFVGALTVPNRLFPVFNWKKQWPPFLRVVDGIVLPGSDEVRHLILNAKVVVGLPTPEKHVKSQPACRLREPILADIRSWLASYGARPGYTRIEP